jgi:hypothetical protein
LCFSSLPWLLHAPPISSSLIWSLITTLMKWNQVHNEIKGRMNFGNAGYYLVQTLSKMQLRIYRIVVFPLVSYRCETWLLTMREGHKLRAWKQSAQENIST